ncbi:hypothetical protein HK096_005100 [Nowakowskiella sp. JEL0078]|nr:hypothetical protein HK096_005100 [Nowakowskiella sp. JEL0078]
MKFQIPLTLVCIITVVNTVAAFYAGADISSILVSEAAGSIFSDTTGAKGSVENILKNHGANLVRIRVWTSGDYNTATALKIAKRARAAGMSILLALHYSDSWADPGKQVIPSGWPTTVSGLETQLYTYTRDTLKTFINAGVPIALVQIGNEIDGVGMLLPVGATNSHVTGGFDNFSSMLHSAASGARAASPSTKIVLHLANGWNLADTQWFLTNSFKPGKLVPADVDVIGASFYPYYSTSATFASLQSSLNWVVSTYGKVKKSYKLVKGSNICKDVFIAETNFPVSACKNAISEPSIPRSVAGQVQWITKLKSVLSGIGSHAIGFSWWEPSWLQNSDQGSNCGDVLLFTKNGVARSSISVFGK